MTVTAEGLRIELLESEKGTFFDSGSSALNKSGQEMLVLLAEELGKVPNHISIDGHTDAKPFAEKANYSNWELSSDRANAARRLMQQSGVGGDQVSQVRGFADQRLRDPKDPLEASNRRISNLDHRAVRRQGKRRRRQRSGRRWRGIAGSGQEGRKKELPRKARSTRHLSE